jgi:hypothetical protein
MISRQAGWGLFRLHVLLISWVASGTDGER